MVAASLIARSLVLVVEDDRNTREFYRLTLSNAGYAVVAVEDGISALRFLQDNTPAAVVLDLGLPRLHGGDVYREMGAHGLLQRIPVVVVTGEPALDIEGSGFACVLRKPVEPEQLVATIDGCIRAIQN